jgi:hypothetical protein
VAIRFGATGEGEEFFLEAARDGAGDALPTWILSTERVGVISTAVPQKKTSSTM